MWNARIARALSGVKDPYRAAEPNHELMPAGWDHEGRSGFKPRTDGVENVEFTFKQVIVTDLSDVGDPVRPGMNDWQLAGTLPALREQAARNTGHFYYSAPGGAGARRRDDLAAELVRRGVK